MRDSILFVEGVLGARNGEIAWNKLLEMIIKTKCYFFWQYFFLSFLEVTNQRKFIFIVYLFYLLKYNCWVLLINNKYC